MMNELPTEIYLHISGWLTLRELARLNQCNRSINNRWESYLLSIPVARDQLMYWGCCRGQTWAIQKAISYGADVSAVGVWSNFEIAENPVYSTCLNLPDTKSTLVLAAQQDDLVAYEFLLRAGARIDPADNRGKRWELLAGCLFNFQRPEPLRLYLKFGSKRDIPYFQNELDRTLRKSVFNRVGEDACRAWLDLGANPLAVGGGHGSEGSGSALAMAMVTGPVPLARLMRTRASADLSLAHLYSFVHSGFCVPSYHESVACISVLAAAHNLADSGLPEMIDLSLEAHENINMTVVSQLDLPGPRQWYMMNAVMAYVLRVDCDRDQKAGILSPSEGLQYLFHKGALAIHTHAGHLGGYPTHSLLWLFWHKWDRLEGLLNNEVHAILRILARKKAAWGLLLGFLSSIRTGRNNTRLIKNTEQHNIITSRWSSLLDLVLIERNCFLVLKDEMNNLLFRLLLYTMEQIVKLDLALSDITPGTVSPDTDCSTAECEVITIQKLINKGADIKWTPTWGEYKGHSILDWIARWYIRHESLHMPTVQYNQQRSFVNTLVRLGAERPDDLLSGLLSEPDIAYERWARFVFGEVPEEEVLLWNSRAAPLLGCNSNG
ncbi:unnamed protein product [Clonostachys solani]|uniref:F-box domain-containing protein n=1 Tax=Clonostachys solani TaxID=160281 RepID=A0A9N9YZZ0_9HYPO|nr:unnamed protein product [Clonostachys solani]